MLLAAALNLGCMSPQARFETRLQEAGLAREMVRGTRFDHMVVRKGGRAIGALHIYIEGDGTPWLSITQPAADPTPRSPLAFELMLRDPYESIYVGRPCYFGVMFPGCDARMWTHQRYSDMVVDSMSAAIAAARQQGDTRPVILLGHSGGGVLAVLLAHRLNNVIAIVTVAANLDVAEWTALHGYSPLAGSLDPAQLPRDDKRVAVPEHHYVGGDDRVVPPWIVRSYAHNRPSVTVSEWPDFDHVCCWTSVWADIVATLPEL
jgi:pimeloyl-ACP methyl ester carboxylesterase